MLGLLWNGRTIINGRTIYQCPTYSHMEHHYNSRTIINAVRWRRRCGGIIAWWFFGEKDLELAEEGEDGSNRKFYDSVKKLGQRRDDFQPEILLPLIWWTGSDVWSTFLIIPGTFESKDFNRLSYLPANSLYACPTAYRKNNCKSWDDWVGDCSAGNYSLIWKAWSTVQPYPWSAGKWWSWIDDEDR